MSQRKGSRTHLVPCWGVCEKCMEKGVDSRRRLKTGATEKRQQKLKVERKVAERTGQQRRK